MAANYSQQQQYPPQQYPPQQYPPQQYPPQQGGYYPPPQQQPPGSYPAGQTAYYQGGYAPPVTQHVVIQQPVAPVVLGRLPTSCTCPHCHAAIVTKIDHRVGSTTMLYCLMLSCFCCCCIPFCTDCAKDVGHTCPNCGTQLGMAKASLVDSGGGSGSRPKYDSTFHGPGDDGTGYGADSGGGGGDGD